MSAVADRVRSLLLSRGREWSAPIEHHDAVASTNDRLRDLAHGGAPPWTVVLADRQTQGRGRQGRSWHSPLGGLFLSVLLRPALPTERLGLLPLAAGVATAEALETFGVPARLKWPNDVLVGGTKIGGILCEAASGRAGIEWVVVGIGVNVATPDDALPAELRERSTSVARESAMRAEPAEVAAAVLSRLPDWYDAVVGGRLLLETWRSRSVPWWGRLVEVSAGAEVLHGRLRDVAEDGGLLLEVDGGRIMKVLSGDVRELRLSADAGGARPLP